MSAGRRARRGRSRSSRGAATRQPSGRRPRSRRDRRFITPASARSCYGTLRACGDRGRRTRIGCVGRDAPFEVRRWRPLVLIRRTYTQLRPWWPAATACKRLSATRLPRCNDLVRRTWLIAVRGKRAPWPSRGLLLLRVAAYRLAWRLAPPLGPLPGPLPRTSPLDTSLTQSEPLPL